MRCIVIMPPNMARRLRERDGYIARAKQKLQLRELSALSDEGRSEQRYIRVLLTALSAAGARGISVAVELVTIPLVLRYLGPELFGLWITLASFTALLIVSDLGFSQGLVSAVSTAEGSDDPDLVPELVASAFYMLLGVTAILGIGFALVHPGIEWSSVFNVTSVNAIAVVDEAVAVLVWMTLVTIPFGIAAKIREGQQMGFIAYLWVAAGGVLSLIGVILAMALGADLRWLVFALASAPLLAALLNTVSIVRDRPDFLPLPKRASAAGVTQLLSLGVLFFVVQTSGVAGFVTDNLVVARLLGSEVVTEYAVPMKLFMVIPVAVGFLLRPLWPAYSEALARGDVTWFASTARRSFKLAAIAGVGLSTVLAIVARPAIQIWAGSGVSPSNSHLLALACFSALFTVGVAAAQVFYALNAVRYLAITAFVGVAVNLAASIQFTRQIGVTGPVWGSVISLGPLLIAHGLYIKRALSQLELQH